MAFTGIRTESQCTETKVRHAQTDGCTFDIKYPEKVLLSVQTTMCHFFRTVYQFSGKSHIHATYKPYKTALKLS